MGRGYDYAAEMEENRARHKARMSLREDIVAEMKKALEHHPDYCRAAVVTRLINVAWGEGVMLSDLATRRDDELLKLPNFGFSCLYALRVLFDWGKSDEKSKRRIVALSKSLSESFVKNAEYLGLLREARDILSNLDDPRAVELYKKIVTKTGW